MKAFSGNTLTVVLTNARRIIKHLDSWSFNRKVDDKHVDAIYTDLKQMMHPHLIGSIKVVRDKTRPSVMRVIDGQHRMHAIRKLLVEDVDMQWDMSLQLDVYDVDHIDDGIDTFSIFDKANRNRNVTVEDLPDANVVQIVNAICADPILNPPKNPNIVMKDTGGVWRPRILKKDLYHLFTEHYKPTGHATAEQVVQKIKELNNNYSMMTMKQLYGRDNPSTSKMNAHKRAEQFRFFLNLDCRFSPEVWIKLL